MPPSPLTFVAAMGESVALATPPTAAPAKAAAMAGSLLTQLALAFLGGFILNFMPCVLPVISLKLLSFLNQSGQSRGRIFILNVWYVLGVLAVFMLLAVLATTAKMSWGEQFTLPWFKIAMTVLVFAMALSFLGVWELPIPGFAGSRKADKLQIQEGPSGAFFKGVFATVLATPCSGPLLGSVFGWLLYQQAHVAYLVFGSMGLGMSFPYLLIGAFPQLIRFLPRPGVWMEVFKEFLAFLLLATVVYLFSTLSAAYFLPTLSTLIGVWFGCWIIGRVPFTAAPSRRVSAWLGATILAALIGFLSFTLLMSESKIPWKPFSPEAVAAARAEGKTVMVDFSADWCLTCKANLKFAIQTDDVKALVEKNRVVPLLADWTDRSDTIKKALNDLGYNSIPVLVIYPPQGDPIIQTDLLSKGDVLQALTKAGPSR